MTTEPAPTTSAAGDLADATRALAAALAGLARPLRDTAVSTARLVQHGAGRRGPVGRQFTAHAALERRGLGWVLRAVTRKQRIPIGARRCAPGAGVPG